MKYKIKIFEYTTDSLVEVVKEMESDMNRCPSSKQVSVSLIPVSRSWSSTDQTTNEYSY